MVLSTCVRRSTCGTPAASPVDRVHLVREVLEHGRTGLLVAEGDASAMAEAIHGLLNNPVQAQHLALAARQQAETEFDLSVMQARHASLLRAVQSGKALTMSSTPCHPE